MTIVSGSPGSGKTERLVRLAAERYETDRFVSTLVLVPTARHGDQFRRRVVARCGVALNLDVTTVGLLARRYIDASVPTNDLAAELIRRVTLQRIESGGAARFAPIADTPGLHALLSAALAELVSTAVEPDALDAAATASGLPDQIALADVYRAYRRALEAAAWRDPREAPTLAAEAVLRGAPLPDVVLVDSFELLRPREVDLVAAMARRSDVVVTLDVGGSERARWTDAQLAERIPGLTREELAPRAAARALTAHSAFDAEAQLREIARAIKLTLTDDPSLRPSDVAVVFRQATPHLALARRVFAEYDLPFDPAAGERLAERPFGAWVLGLLRLAAHDWRLSRIAELLRSRFLDRRRWDIAPDTADHAMRLGRAHRLLAGLDDLHELPRALELESTFASEDGRDAYAERLELAGAALRRATEDLVGLLDAGPRTAGAWAAALDDMLFGESALVAASADGYESLEVETAALLADLDALRAIDETLGARPISLAEFTEELEHRMQRPAVLLREAGGVLFAPMHTLHGLRFAHVFLGGLAEGEFPAPRHAPGLVDRRNRELLAAAGLELPPEPRATEEELWRTASTRAELRTALWRPRLGSGGKPVAASYYFHAAGATPIDQPAAVPPEAAASQRELAVSLSSRWRDGERRSPRGFEAWPLVVRVAAPIEQRRRSFGAAGVYEGWLPGAEVLRLTSGDARWSASRLETYRTCAFQFFARYALRLSELDEDLAEADAALRGTVVHEILEDALLPLVDESRALEASTIDASIQRVRERGGALWESAPERHAFGRAALWRFGWDEVVEDLEGLLRREAELNEALGVERVAGQELSFDVALPGVDPALRLVGSIDRADASGGLAQIVDYKSGRPIRRADLEAGRRLQLQLYALAAREQLGAERLVARYAYLDPRADEWALDTAKAGDAELIEQAAELAEAARASVVAGDFRVNPQVDPCPSYCEFRHVCRVNQFTRFKAWS